MLTRDNTIDTHKNNFKMVLLLAFIASVHLNCACDILNAITRDSAIVWQTPLSTQRRIDVSFPIQVLPNGVLYVGRKADKHVLYLLDKATGKPLWEWEEWLRSEFGMLVKDIYSYGDICIFQDGRRVYAINVKTGKTQWSKQDTPGVSTGVTGIGDKCFYSNNYTQIVQTNVITGNTDTVMTFDTVSGSRVFAETPLIFTNQKNDTLLVTQCAFLK